MHPLASAWAKLRRAGEHINVLHGEIQDFFLTRPYTIEAKYEREFSEAILWVNIWEYPPSSRWGPLIGDAVQNLRQALDHLAWAFAEAGTGGTDTTEFPIFRNKERFFRQDRGGGLSKIAGIDDTDLRTLIQSMQPFGSGDNGAGWEPLWVLHRLSIIDKHRFMQLAGAILSDQTITAVAVPLDSGPRHDNLLDRQLDVLDWYGGGPFQHQTNIGRVNLPSGYGNVAIAGEEFLIVFPDASPAAGKPVIQELSTLAGIVQVVLQRFMPYVHRLS